MPRFKVSLLTACGLLVLAGVLGAIGPKRALAALGFTPVREVNAPGRQPFAIEGSAGPLESFNFTVPANKRLVITAVSSFNTFGDPVLTVHTQVGGIATDLFVPYNTNGFANSTGDALAAADPGTTVALQHHGSGLGAAIDTIHGYYVDVP